MNIKVCTINALTKEQREWIAKPYKWPGQRPIVYLMTREGKQVEATYTEGHNSRYTYFRMGGKAYYLPKEAGWLPEGSTIWKVGGLTMDLDRILELTDSAEILAAVEVCRAAKRAANNAHRDRIHREISEDLDALGKG